MSIIDSSVKPKNVTLNNGASISTTKSRFGAGSLALNGSGQYASIPDNTDFGFGTGDFTIEMWVYPVDNNNYRTLISVGTHMDGLIWRMCTEGNQLWFNGTPWNWGANSVPLNKWSHLALVRNSGTIKVYINGTESLSVSGGAAAGNLGSSRAVSIGAYGSSETFNGYLDEIRITKGIGSARYTGNFSVNSILAPAPSSGTSITPANVVTDLIAAAGSHRITMTWTPPLEDNGGIITDYSIQYSSDSGSSWNDFSRSPSSSNLVNVTGLTNDTSYLTRVAPINVAGTGNYVTIQSALTPALPPEDTSQDPYYYNTVLLLHMNGDNNTTTITDNSRFSRSCSTAGDTKISVLQSKFGDSSAYFDGSGDYITVPNSAGLDFGSGDFTIEYWEYRTDSGDSRPVMCRVATDQGYNPFLLGYKSGSTLYAYASSEYVNTQNWDIVSALSMGSVVYNSWTHYAFVRQGNTFRTYQNGIQIATTSSSSSIAFGNGPLNIGRYRNSEYYQGYLDDIRITKGICRYPDGTTFSVRTLPFSNIGASPVAPNAPTSVTAYGGDTVADLTWNAPAFEGYAPLSSYGLEVSENSDPKNWTTKESTTKLLLHFDTTDFNNDDTLKDFSLYNRSVSFNKTTSPAYIAVPFNGCEDGYSNNCGSFTPQKFGTGCLQVPNVSASPSYILKTPQSSDLDPGTGDYTLEFFWWPQYYWNVGYTRNGIGRLFGSNNASSGSYWGVQGIGNYSYTMRLSKYVNGNQVYYVDIDNSTATGSMKHFVFSRQNGTLRIFMNGSKIKENADTNNDVFSAGGLVIMGGDSGSHYANNYVYGRLDELRYTVGESLYNANFDLLPQAAFKNSRIIGLTNNSSYVFRMRSQNSSGYGDYSSESSPITVAPPPDIIISSQPKNDRVTTWNDNGSFSVTATVEDGSNPTYQWQKSMPSDYNGNKIWVNIDNATSSSLTINSNSFQDYNYNYYGTGMDAVRCLLSSAYGSKLSKPVRLVNLSYTLPNIYVNTYYSNNYIGTDYSHNYSDIYGLNANGSFNIEIENYNGGYGPPADASWYTGNDTRILLQYSTDYSTWNDASAYKDIKFNNGSYYQNISINMEDKSGSVYYRFKFIDLWPYSTNNGTESNTESSYSTTNTYNTFRIDYTATVPGVPRNVVGDSGDNMVVLSWDAPLLTGGASVTSYTIQYSSNSGSSWTTFGTSSSRSANITGLSNGTGYIFRVAATNSVGLGSYSSNSSIVTPDAANATVPGSPTNVTGIAGNTKVLLNWIAPSDIGKSVLTDYAIQYSTDDGDTWTTYTDPTP
jgi:Concanavalin A-like lectin/glucanases superfamily/Fibronectin type III domain